MILLMGSIKRGMFKAKKSIFAFILALPIFLFQAQRGYAAEQVSLAGQISTLEKISLSAQSSEERYDAFMLLARLYQLSGNSEASLKSLEGALIAIPGDGRALLETGRILISHGEYEKAEKFLAALLIKDHEREIMLEGRYLIALLEAFRSENTGPMLSLAEDGDFEAYRSAVYYILLKLEGNPAWELRLMTEFPLSPEAKIAKNPAFAARTPQWLLFPGRSAVVPGALPVLTVAPAPVTMPVPALLQAGVFSKEENARALTDRLKKAGFNSQIHARLVNGENRWFVNVLAGSDINLTMKKLKDAGFDSVLVN